MPRREKPVVKTRVPPPRAEYLTFLSPYDPAVRELALSTRRLVLEEAPDSMELIYDAYNAVATGYSFTGLPSDSFIHVAVYAGWVNLGFNYGAELEDPQGLLVGKGRQVRHIRIAQQEDLEKPTMRAFVRAAVARAVRPDAQAQTSGTKGKSVVRAVYAKRRRPGAARPAAGFRERG
jgi:hypothetical protein